MKVWKKIENKSERDKEIKRGRLDQVRVRRDEIAGESGGNHNDEEKEKDNEKEKGKEWGGD